MRLKLMSKMKESTAVKDMTIVFSIVNTYKMQNLLGIEIWVVTKDGEILECLQWLSGIFIQSTVCHFSSEWLRERRVDFKT